MLEGLVVEPEDKLRVPCVGLDVAGEIDQPQQMRRRDLHPLFDPNQLLDVRFLCKEDLLLHQEQGAGGGEVHHRHVAAVAFLARDESQGRVEFRTTPEIFLG